jgi:general secretion pathway protein D
MKKNLSTLKPDTTKRLSFHLASVPCAVSHLIKSNKTLAYLLKPNTAPEKHHATDLLCHTTSPLVTAATLVAMSLVLASPVNSALAASAKKQAADSTQKDGLVTLNFVNADIEAVARTLSALSGRNLVVDPRVKGVITLNADKPVTAQAAWNQFLAALRLQSYSVIEANGLYKIVPEAEAKLQGGVTTIVPSPNAPNSGQIMTQIFNLHHENANNLVSVLRPLISPNNTINVNPGTNSLVITDYAENLQRVGKIIASLDISNASDVEIITLNNSIATDLAPIVSRLIEVTPSSSGSNPSQTQGSDSSYKTTILAEPRSNSLIIRAANSARLTQAKLLIEKLDRPSSELSWGNIHVVYLKNADAVKLASTLRAALSAELKNSSNGTLNAGSGVSGMTSPLSTNPGGINSMNTSQGVTNSTSPGPTLGGFNMNSSPSTGGQIQADPATNALIITAPEPQFRQLKEVIDKLDTRRAQVMVESLIAEIDTSKIAQFGIQWQNVLGKAGGNIGVIGTNFGSGGSNLLTLSTSPLNQSTTSPSLPGTGLNLATAREVNGVYVLSSLANFLQQDGLTNILSTPTLLTLDNEEAKIVVGQNVPFATGQYTNNNTANGSVTPFTTYDRKDVGITLRVKPQISETGSVKLTIFQEVSSINSTSSTAGLITDKRSIESSVIVEDGSIVVLGGLLSDTYTNVRGQVPGIADWPLIGNLFKNQSRSRTKTNLMVFLRPVVLRDSKSTEILSGGRYQGMMNEQKSLDSQPLNDSSFVLPANQGPTLPDPKAIDLSPSSSNPKLLTPNAPPPISTLKSK